MFQHRLCLLRIIFYITLAHEILSDLPDPPKIPASCPDDGYHGLKLSESEFKILCNEPPEFYPNLGEMCKNDQDPYSFCFNIKYQLHFTHYSCGSYTDSTVNPPFLYHLCVVGNKSINANYWTEFYLITSQPLGPNNDKSQVCKKPGFKVFRRKCQKQ